MDMREAMEYAGQEGMRLLATGSSKSTVVMSTVLDTGDVARMTINIEVLENPAVVARRVQQEQDSKEQTLKPGQTPLPPRAPQPTVGGYR